MRPKVCVDLDGVLASYEGWKGVDEIGDPLPGAVQFLEELQKFSRPVVFSTRTNEAFHQTITQKERGRIIEAWMTRHGIRGVHVALDLGKPLAMAYVDDRAVECRPQDEEDAFEKALRKIKWLCGERD